MGAVRAQVILHTDSGVAADFITNTWCFTTPSPFGAVTAYTAAFKGFYDNLVTYFGSSIAQNGHEIKYYDLPGPGAPNYPVATSTFNLVSDPNSASLPPEVAVCLSFQGLKVPGSPQNRRRGRVYIGTLNATANNGGVPAAALLTAMANGAQTFDAAMNAASLPATWSVWSHTDQAAVPVANGWIDNAFDTQRRRGVKATSRTTFVT